MANARMMSSGVTVQSCPEIRWMVATLAVQARLGVRNAIML